MPIRKVISITEDGMVRLSASPVRWGSWPWSLKKRLLDGAKNISQIRSQISLSAKLRWMPPIEIVDEVWIGEGGTIHGKATSLRVGGNTYFGVQLPAQTAVHGDKQDVRSILIHEFAHCFYFYEECIRAGKSGRNMLDFSDNVNDEQSDSALFPILSDWFDTADVVNFAYWNDTRLSQIDQNIALLTKLPRVSPQGRFADTFQIPDEVASHINQLMGGISM